jgi:hypothetical protein
MTTFYCLRFETLPTWRTRYPYLYPLGTGWPSYTHRHWVPFSSPPTTRRAVEVFDSSSAWDLLGWLSEDYMRYIPEARTVRRILFVYWESVSFSRSTVHRGVNWLGLGNYLFHGKNLSPSRGDIKGDITLTPFFFQVYRGLKSCTTLLENVFLIVPTRNVKDFLTFSVCPSARCACAASAVSNSTYLQPEPFLWIVFYNLLPKIVNNI